MIYQRPTAEAREVSGSILTAEIAPPPNVALFVHGFWSDKETWEPLLKALRADDSFTGRFALETFAYPTPKFRTSILSRIPELPELAELLATAVRERAVLRDAKRIVLLGHSQGGLVIQRYLLDQLTAGRGESLDRIKAVVLYATPNTGSEILLSLRKGLARFLGYFHNPQEKTLRPLDDEVARTGWTWRRRCAGTT